MKFRYLSLGIAILACAAMLAGVGAYLKYDVLKPLGIYQDKSIFELPFLMQSDDYLRFMVENADLLLQNPPDTEPSDPTQPSSTGASEPSQPTKPSDATLPSDTTQPSGSDPTVPSSDPVTQPPTTTTAPPQTKPTTPKDEPNFDFPGESVDNSWFDNVLFIGDSRVVGLRDYARSGNADYFCDVGMSLFNYSSKQLSDKNFSKQKLTELLSSKKYDKIIINFGLNEAGYPLNSFKLAYTQFVDTVQQYQPDAKIILQGIMSVTRKKAASASYFAVSNLQKMSAQIESLADGEKIFYIDCNEYFADSEGYLYSALSNDGCHPTGSGYRNWRDWIAFAVNQLDLS